jgi:predicted amidohydrolase YtcJ
MSAGPLVAPVDGAYTIGPVKILLDDHNLPDLGDFVARIALAQKWGRPVAVHCVTAAELALALAAFKVAGTFAENRIEHGGIIVKEAIPQLRALGLTVITQPSFIRERGDRYAAEIHARERDNLYRCGSLLAAAVRVAAGSDAPYASADPWASMRTAIERRTRTGRTLGAAERVTPEQALRMYLGQPAVPGRTIRRVAVGARADLCLLKAPLRDVLEAPNSELVQATLLGGSVIYEAP